MPDRLTVDSPLTVASRALAAARTTDDRMKRRELLCVARDALERSRSAVYHLEQRIRIAERTQS